MLMPFYFSHDFIGAQGTCNQLNSTINQMQIKITSFVKFREPL